MKSSALIAEDLPDEIVKDLKKACSLHDRATSDYEKCVEFSKLMIDLSIRLEDGGYTRTADKVMGILIDCNPKEGASCEKSSLVSERVKKLI